MAIDLDDEILQDFLVEAGEILELLGEQLVELEQTPEDLDLLNAIFRGFHTVKGGAGFLAIDPLIEVCHKAEDVFNILRQGDRKVSAELMDVFLQVLDVVNEMFDQIRSGEDPVAAEPELLTKIQSFNSPETESAQVAVEPIVQEEIIPEPIEEISEPAGIIEPDAVEAEFENMLDSALGETVTSVDKASSDEITEDEFDQLLDVLHGKGQFTGKVTQNDEKTADVTTAESKTSTPAADEITEDEFDQLLDDLHGKGKFTGKDTQTDDTKADAEQEQAKKMQQNAPAADEITEDEFDQLLDDLHGKGKFTGKVTQTGDTDTGQEQAKGIQQNAPAADEITEDEFDQLLDDLHGKGKFTGKVKGSEQEPAQAAPSTPPPKPKPEPTPKPAPKAPTSSTAKKPAKPAATQGETTVRVDTHVLDDIMNMVGELVLVRNRFQTLKDATESSEQLTKAVANLDIVTADLQLAVMKTRMQPIKKVFGRFPRVVRDLARSLKKEIKLDLVGEETDLDKNLVEALADPLVHLVRNAVDHGVESPDERMAAGKPREGTIILTASQEGDHIELSIKDDGKGMNADALRTKVIEKGLMDEESASRLDDKECFNLIFLPGFSTKTEISDVSGRGVGMDVVKTRISQMNGTVEVDSREGVGSTITIKVPLTLAIMPTLMVKLADQAFALPLANVLEILDLDLGVTNVVDGQLVVMVREKALPLFYLSDWLVNDPSYVREEVGTGHVVVVNASGRQIGFVVDQLIGQEEVVIKALGAKLQGLEGLAGATITGDGKIALILDVPGMMKRYAH